MVKLGIFSLGGESAAYVPFLLVDLKDLLDLKVEAVVDLRKPVLNVLVDGRFTDTELLGCGAHRGAVFYDVNCQIAGPLFNITLHE